MAVAYPVVVPARAPSSPATRALVIEGYDVIEVIVVDDEYKMSRLLTERWSSGGGFVWVEDDVVPWPGAIGHLMDCQHDWCAYEFPRTYVQWEPRSGFVIGLGCVKFSAELTRRYAGAWNGVPRDALDGTVIGMLQQAGETVHVHYPPVAHLKAHITVHRRGEMTI